MNIVRPKSIIFLSTLYSVRERVHIGPTLIFHRGKKEKEVGQNCFFIGNGSRHQKATARLFERQRRGEGKIIITNKLHFILRGWPPPSNSDTKNAPLRLINTCYHLLTIYLFLFFFFFLLILLMLLYFINILNYYNFLSYLIIIFSFPSPFL